MRDVLALIRCGNRINEVTTATLGPLPLDQLPKSKPVTPYAVLPDPTTQPSHRRFLNWSVVGHRHGSQPLPTIIWYIRRETDITRPV